MSSALPPGLVGSAAALLALCLAVAGLWGTFGALRRRMRRQRVREAKLRAVFDASPDAMWIKDAAGVFRECNQRAAVLFGRGRAALLGQTDESVFDAATAAACRASSRAVCANRQPQRQRILLRADRETPRVLELSEVPLVDGAGVLHGSLCVARDVTGHEQEETRSRLWAHAFEQASFALAILDPSTRRIVAVNPAFARERGYAPADLTGRHVNVLVPPDDVAQWETRKPLLLHEPHTVLEATHVDRGGRAFPVALDVSVTHGGDGRPEQLVIYARDLSRERQAARERQLLDAAFALQVPLMVVALDGTIERVNAALIKFSGYAEDELVGHAVTRLDLESGGNSFRRLFAEELDGRRQWLGEKWINVRAGRPRVVQTLISGIANADGAAARYLCSLVDRSGERDAREHIERLSFFDRVTGLPNRHSLHGQLQHALTAPFAAPAVLLLADVHGFRHINERHGYAAGDQVLRAVARRLEDVAGDDAVVARLDSATFAIVRSLEVPAADVVPWTSNFAAIVANRLASALDGSSLASLRLDVAIGWTRLTPGFGSPDLALQEAEMALAQAKHREQGRCCRFEPAMRERAANAAALLAELRDAIAAERLGMYLQPQVDAQGRVTGAEALLRWRRRDGELVPPERFIPVAERHGLVRELGRQVGRRCCEQLAAWARVPAMAALVLAVNVSGCEFADPEFVPEVLRTLAETGADPSRLKLEVTESTVIADIDAASGKLARLRAAGIGIALDDFGTGHSSLAWLARLPVQQLKIDHSFVAGLPRDRQSAVLVRSIIGLAHGLGAIEVLAEGVESPQQWQLLKDEGCDAFQGWLFSHAVPVAAFEALMAQGGALPRVDRLTAA